MSCLDQIYLLKTNSSVKRYKIANTSFRICKRQIVDHQASSTRAYHTRGLKLDAHISGFMIVFVYIRRIQVLYRHLAAFFKMRGNIF